MANRIQSFFRHYFPTTPSVKAVADQLQLTTIAIDRWRQGNGVPEPMYLDKIEKYLSDIKVPNSDIKCDNEYVVDLYKQRQKEKKIHIASLIILIVSLGILFCGLAFLFDGRYLFEPLHWLGFIVLPLFVIFWIPPFIRMQCRGGIQETIWWRQRSAVIVFTLYCAIAYSLAFRYCISFPVWNLADNLYVRNATNFIPLKTIIMYISNFDFTSFELNIFMFIIPSLLWSRMGTKWKKFRYPFAYFLLLGTLIEITQLFGEYTYIRGGFNIDAIILRIFGVLIGWKLGQIPALKKIMYMIY